jgi:FtsH-binding integral membrane protein
MDQSVSYPIDRAAAVPAEFVRRVFAWMFAGLALTSLAALYTAGSPALLKAIFGNKLVFYALVFGELGLVIAISGAINRLSAAAATGLFLLYSALNGVTLASIFLVYTGGSIATTFFVSASTFGAMSLYGYLTKKDLTSWGSFLFMGLIGVIIASLVNLFLHSPMVAWVMSVCGVIVFVGLTAYDTQKIKVLGAAGFGDDAARRKASILGALTLYLDFINLFLMLLNLFGRRR